MLRDGNYLSRYVEFRLAPDYFYAVFPCKVQLGLRMLSCACIFGFLNNHNFVFRELPGKGYGSCKGGVACRPSL